VAVDLDTSALGRVLLVALVPLDAKILAAAETLPPAHVAKE